MTPSLLTIGRRAVWEAIDNWPALDGQFRMKFRAENPDEGFTPTERVSPSDGPTGQNELPALSILPATSEHDWITNATAADQYALAITIWTSGWGDIARIEWLYEQVTRAIQENKPVPSATPTYVSRAASQGGTGSHGKILPSRFQRTRIGSADNEKDRPKVTALTFGVMLKLRMQHVRD